MSSAGLPQTEGSPTALAQPTTPLPSAPISVVEGAAALIPVSIPSSGTAGAPCAELPPGWRWQAWASLAWLMTHVAAWAGRAARGAQPSSQPASQERELWRTAEAACAHRGVHDYDACEKEQHVHTREHASK